MSSKLEDSVGALGVGAVRVRQARPKPKTKQRTKQKHNVQTFYSISQQPKEVRIDLPITISLSNDATVAIGELGMWGTQPPASQSRFYYRVAKGTAKRNRGDEPNTTIGSMIATYRVLEVLSNRLRRTVDGYIRHQDWLAQQKKKPRLSPDEAARRRKEAFDLSRRRAEQRMLDKKRKQAERQAAVRTRTRGTAS